MPDHSLFLDIHLKALLLLLTVSILLWLLSLAKRDSSIIDPFWSLLFFGVTIFYLLNLENNSLSNRAWIIVVLVSIWAFRLFLHLIVRNWSKEEDYRYQSFRKQWGKNYWWGSYFQVFLLQAILAWLISTTIGMGMVSIKPLAFLDYLAVVVWIIGFFFEAVGDYQLVRFKAEPENKGKLLTSGLWKYTRHPNYFGDAACWWSYGLLALSGGYFFGIAGSLIMTYLLLNVSGVSLLERSLGKTKPGYEDYMRKTSAFLPRPPKQ
jgi:steroid 5-alpha reductase family enzyme